MLKYLADMESDQLNTQTTISVPWDLWSLRNHTAQSSEENIDTDACVRHVQITKKHLLILIDNTKMTIRNTLAVVRVPNWVAATDSEAHY